jgi:uncharacterized phiE125 gp8 family phage protein
MGLTLITAPAFAPVSMAEAKAHLRQVDDDEDDLIALYLGIATRNVEDWTGRALVDQTWQLALDTFPDEGEILIPKPPLIEVVSVVYDDADGNEQTISTDDYDVDTASEPGWVVPVTDVDWPTPLEAINAIRIRFRAGYVDTNSPPTTTIPPPLKGAVLLELGSLFEHRSLIEVGAIPYQLPFGIQNMLRPYRVLLGMA